MNFSENLTCKAGIQCAAAELHRKGEPLCLLCRSFVWVFGLYAMLGGCVVAHGSQVSDVQHASQALTSARTGRV